MTTKQVGMNVENKIALVTGGANGLGLAYATELLRNGVAHVAILDLVSSNGEEAEKKLNEEFGQGKAIFVICDVTKPQELEAGFAKTVAEFGGLDIVINNAGIGDEKQWELMISINYIIGEDHGTIRCDKQFNVQNNENALIRGTFLGLQNMGKNKGGKGGVIVNVSSIVGVMPAAFCPVYVGIKHAIIGFSRSLAMPYHYEKTGVRVLTMCPGFTETLMATRVVEEDVCSMDVESVINEVKKFPWQKVDSVARSMASIIQSAKNGSVWIAEGGEPAYEILIPDRHAMKIP